MIVNKVNTSNNLFTVLKLRLVKWKWFDEDLQYRFLTTSWSQMPSPKGINRIYRAKLSFTSVRVYDISFWYCRLVKSIRRLLSHGGIVKLLCLLYLLSLLYPSFDLLKAVTHFHLVLISLLQSITWRDPKRWLR